MTSAASASIPVDSEWSIRHSCWLRRATLTKAVTCICVHFVNGSLQQRSSSIYFRLLAHYVYAQIFVGEHLLLLLKLCRLQVHLSPCQRQWCLSSIRSTLPQSRRVLVECRQWTLKGCPIHAVIVLDCWVTCTPFSIPCDKIHEGISPNDLQNNSSWHLCAHNATSRNFAHLTAVSESLTPQQWQNRIPI